MSAYYNEIDPYAAAWLRRLIAAGHIADGIVDERSIEDIHPAELREFTQCHFFAGIGVWSRALRLANWADTRRVWTGSCPCQPFSAAGKGAGFADERHLWPAFHHLIAECRPPVVFGEQVASKDGLQWLDLVRADLEGSGYGVGAADLCAAGVGAPHIRQRLWWVAQSDCERGRGDAGGVGDAIRATRERVAGSLFGAQTAEHGARKSINGGVSERLGDAGSSVGGLANTVRGGTWDNSRESVGAQAASHISNGGVSRQRLWTGVEGSLRGLANTSETGRSRQREDNDCCPEVADGRQAGSGAHIAGRSTSCGLDNNNNTGLEGLGCGHRAEGGREGAVRPVAEAGESGGVADAKHDDGRADEPRRGPQRRAADGWDGSVGVVEIRGWSSPTNGHWGDADWLFCRDGKWRPVEPGTFPLVDGAPSRVGRLRAYGNAIVCQVAQTFIQAYLDIRG